MFLGRIPFRILGRCPTHREEPAAAEGGRPSGMPGSGRSRAVLSRAGGTGAASMGVDSKARLSSVEGATRGGGMESTDFMGLSV